MFGMSILLSSSSLGLSTGRIALGQVSAQYEARTPLSQPCNLALS